MRIEEGKFYVTRDGHRFGPMRRSAAITSDFECPQHAYRFNCEGETLSGGGHHPKDLVSEWVARCVRTVTRKEIVQGTYGRVNVKVAMYRCDREAGDVSIVLTDRDGKVGPELRTLLNAAELRAAAATFIELADALPLHEGSGE